MAKYGVSFGAFATTTSILTALKFVSATKFPFEVVELGMYGSGSVAPADIQHEATAAFVSAAGAGTGTASPPLGEPMSKSSPAASTTILWKMSVEPTTYATVFPVLFSFNQRGGMRWAVPQGEGLADTFEQTQMHLGFRVRSSAVGTVDGMGNWWER
jgi:hypothetical protein